MSSTKVRAPRHLQPHASQPGGGVLAASCRITLAAPAVVTALETAEIHLKTSSGLAIPSAPCVMYM